MSGARASEVQYESGRCGLDDRTLALIRLSATVATGAALVSYERAVASARAAGASAEDMLDALLTIAPIVGLARLVSATAGLAMGLGYDVDAAFEAVDAPRRALDHPTRTMTT